MYESDIRQTVYRKQAGLSGAPKWSSVYIHKIDPSWSKYCDYSNVCPAYRVFIFQPHDPLRWCDHLFFLFIRHIEPPTLLLFLHEKASHQFMSPVAIYFSAVMR
jgi:hypothetical protein